MAPIIKCSRSLIFSELPEAHVVLTKRSITCEKCSVYCHHTSLSLSSIITCYPHNLAVLRHADVLPMLVRDMRIRWTFFTHMMRLWKYLMCLQKFLNFLDAHARNDGSHAHQTVRNAKICETMGPCWCCSGTARFNGNRLIFFTCDKSFVDDICAYVGLKIFRWACNYSW